MENKFKKYLSLRSEIDRLTDNLFVQHLQHIQCKKGCDLCCMDYSIFPVEFFYIKGKLESKGMPVLEKKTDATSCIFLKNHTCLIYQHRPIICRTHGLPLLYMNNETEEWELSACELNFTDFDNFDTENTFPQDTFNSRLFLLNEEYIQLNHHEEYNKFDLIPLKELLSR